MSDISLTGDSGGVQYSCEVVLLVLDFCILCLAFSTSWSSLLLLSCVFVSCLSTSWSVMLLLLLILVSSVVGSSISLPVGSCETSVLFSVNVFLVLSCSVFSGFCGAGMIEIKFTCSLSNFSCSCWMLTNCSCSFCWLLSASRKITCGLLNFAVLSFNLWIFLTALSILRVLSIVIAIGARGCYDFRAALKGLYWWAVWWSNHELFWVTWCNDYLRCIAFFDFISYRVGWLLQCVHIHLDEWSVLFMFLAAF